MPNMTLQPRRFLYSLLAIVGGLTLLHTVALILDHGFGYDYVMGFSDFVGLDNERNLPTLAAVLMLLLGAVLAAFNAVAERARMADRTGWWIIAAAFLFAALDEHFGFHEPLSYHLRQQFDALPLLAWVVPYGLAVLLLGLIMLPWLLRLDGPSRNGLILAAVLFVSGALGMELISSAHFESLDGGFDAFAAARTLEGDLYATVEEVLELLGVSVFLYTLLNRLGGIGISRAGKLQADPVTTRSTSPA